MITIYWAGIMDSLHLPLSLCLGNSLRLCFLHSTAKAIQLGHQASLKPRSLRCTGDNLLRWPVLLKWMSFLLIWEHNGSSWPFGPGFLLIKVCRHFFLGQILEHEGCFLRQAYFYWKDDVNCKIIIKMIIHILKSKELLGFHIWYEIRTICVYPMLYT